jgi:uncharacterized membrane protein
MIEQILEFLTVELTVLFTAALPIIELRGAIPVGISLGLSPLHAVVISLIGSMIPVPFILFLIRPIFNAMKKTKLLKGIADKLTLRSKSKNSDKIKKYGVWALIPIVAIPLPGTGVWSGSLAAALFDMRFKWAFPAIFVGNLIAAMAVLFFSNVMISLFG